MKRFLLAATALAVTISGLGTTAASAQYHGRDDRGDYRRDDRRGDDARRDRRDDRRDFRNDRRGDRGGYGRYARGQRYRGDGAYVADYRRYGYRAPPRGYRYYRTNQGDVVLAAVATGIIASVIAGNSRY